MTSFLLWLLVSASVAQDCGESVCVVDDLGMALAQAPTTVVAPATTGTRGIATLAIQQTPEGSDYAPELRAFVRAITYTEGAEKESGYFTEVGGRIHPSSTNIHPGAADVYRYSKTGFNSDAYGKYQMLSSTWAKWARRAGIPTVKGGTNSHGEPYYDISPVHQDKAVLAFLRREGIESMLAAGDLEGVLRTWQAHQWASVPGASQPNDRTGSFRAVYSELLEEERGIQSAVPVETAPAEAETESAPTAEPETAPAAEPETPRFRGPLPPGRRFLGRPRRWG